MRYFIPYLKSFINNENVSSTVRSYVKRLSNIVIDCIILGCLPVRTIGLFPGSSLAEYFTSNDILITLFSAVYNLAFFSIICNFHINEKENSIPWKKQISTFGSFFYQLLTKLVVIVLCTNHFFQLIEINAGGLNLISKNTCLLVYTLLISCEIVRYYLNEVKKTENIDDGLIESLTFISKDFYRISSLVVTLFECVYIVINLILGNKGIFTLSTNSKTVSVGIAGLISLSCWNSIIVPTSIPTEEINTETGQYKSEKITLSTTNQDYLSFVRELRSVVTKHPGIMLYLVSFITKSFGRTVYGSAFGVLDFLNRLNGTLFYAYFFTEIFKDFMEDMYSPRRIHFNQRMSQVSILGVKHVANDILSTLPKNGTKIILKNLISIFEYGFSFFFKYYSVFGYYLFPMCLLINLLPAPSIISTVLFTLVNLIYILTTAMFHSKVGLVYKLKNVIMPKTKINMNQYINRFVYMLVTVLSIVSIS